MTVEVFFEKARPVWLQDREYEMNLTAGFRAVFNVQKGNPVVFKVAASAIYRFFVNGEFAGGGPARGPHGYYRVDEWDITDRLHDGKNVLAAEVAGYNVNSYYLLDQLSFLQAEIACGSTIVAATQPGSDNGFTVGVLKERLQKVQRYSFQRPFIEAYAIAEGYDRWRTEDSSPWGGDCCAETAPVPLIPRRLTYPGYRKVNPAGSIAQGTAAAGVKPGNYWKDRSLLNIGKTLKGYPEDELELHLSDEIQEIQTTEWGGKEELFPHGDKFQLVADAYRIVDFGCNLTGFIGLKLKCPHKMRLLLIFDEILSAKDVDFKRLDCVNAVSFELEKGEYGLETFEPYTLKYLKLIALSGGCEVSGVYIRELAGESGAQKPKFENSALDAIFEAAVQSYRQNAVDIYMDCPSRERAGWLCDSFFTARVEFALTGKCLVEKNFLENFALAREFKYLPGGMLPMCYPADHNDGVFIPNWALWFILQLEEYYHRSGDRELVEQLRGKVYGLFDYFKSFRNELGLLEKLESWVFVEWSKANEFVQDVNAPSNMLYSGALAAAGRLFDDAALKKEAQEVKTAVRKLFFDGEFFMDNAVRKNGQLQAAGNHTEVCQYYAFFFDVAAPDTYSGLWKTLIESFGPQRKLTKAFPQVYPANAFIGNYLRLDILSRYGFGEKVLEEIKGYFLYMAEKTGTLWEHDGDSASCNHGFASHVAYWLLKHAKPV